VLVKTLKRKGSKLLRAGNSTAASIPSGSLYVDAGELLGVVSDVHNFNHSTTITVDGVKKAMKKRSQTEGGESAQQNAILCPSRLGSTLDLPFLMEASPTKVTGSL
jgi:hypothetical protein